MSWPTDQQLVKAWGILDKLEPGQIILIKEFAKTEPEIFIQSVKMYMWVYNTLEFNSGYSKVKRLK